MNILSTINKISLDDIYWNLKTGWPKQKLSVFELRAHLNEQIKAPVFFFSTGRCGTKWFSELLKKDKQNAVLHDPQPSFANQNPLIYQLMNSGMPENEFINNLVKEIFFTGREQHMRYIAKAKKRYIETNNYITFFAPVLADIFPDAKFVHLIRHPGEFVRSGVRRGYYTDGNSGNIKRIKPYSHKEKEEWEKFSQIQKITWLWNATNIFIEEFKLNHGERVNTYNFNRLNPDKLEKLFQLMDIELSSKLIEKSINVKSNVQEKGYFPVYDDWSDKERESLTNICNMLAKRYDYIL